MKKFLIFILTFLSLSLYAHASWDSTLNDINNVLNKIDRTSSTIDRIKRRIPTIPQTTSYPQTQTTTQPTYRQTSPNYNYGNSNQYQYINNNDNMPTQQQTQEPYIQQGQQYNQDRVFKGQASTLGELPAGTIVMDPKSVWNYRKGDNYSGEIVASHPVFWRKLEDNHYTDGSTLLLSETRVATYPFCHSQKGLRAWDESDVRRFLRTTFYTHLSEGFKNAIVNVNIPFADMSGNPKTVNDNLFLLSIVEWGLSDRANNGSVIKYNDLPNIYEAKEFNFVKSWNSYTMYGAGRDIQTRTINRPIAKSAGYTNDVFAVRYNGVLATEWSATNLSWVRPAVNLKSSTKVSGPYEFKYSIEKKETLIYYVLEF